jgi:uncharacterized membrane protein YbhN (UPF0104 family)
MMPEPENESDPSASDTRREEAAHTNRARNALEHVKGQLLKRALKLLGYAALAGLTTRLLPDLEKALKSLERVRWQWIVAAVLIETLSESAFVVSWRAIVDPDDVLCSHGRGERAANRVAWLQLGGGMFVPGGSLSSVSVGAWILHRFGMPNKLIAERQFNLQFLNTGVDALALIAFGLALAVGVFPGDHNLTLTLLPAVVAAIAIAAVLLIAGRGPIYAKKVKTAHPKVAASIEALADAVEDAKHLLTHRDGLRAALGAVGYLGFDVAVLWSAFVGIGTHPVPTFPVVVMAYIIGALGGSLPLPAGIGSIGGMTGMFILYGVAAGPAGAAVILYQAVGQLVPLFGGATAYVFLRGKLRPIQRAAAEVS